MDLSKWIGVGRRLRPENAVGWALRLSKALADLHEGQGAHGCVCPEAVIAAGPACHQEASLRAASGLQPRLAYRSPERGESGPASRADDVWAVGVLLYEALTGALPFAEPGAPRPPRALADHGCEAPGLQAVLDRLFHDDPRERAHTAHALLVLLHPHHPDADELTPLDLAPALTIDEPVTVDETEQRTSEDMFLGWLGQVDPKHADEVQAARTSEAAALEQNDEAPAKKAEQLPALESEPGPPSEPITQRHPKSEAESGTDSESDSESDSDSDSDSESDSDSGSESESDSEAVPAKAATEVAATPAAPARRGSRRNRQLVQVAAAAVVLVAAYVVLKRPPKDDGVGPTPASPTPSVSAPPAVAKPPVVTTSATTTATATATSIATAAPSAAPSAAPPIAAPADLDQCMLAMFAEGTFRAEAPSFVGSCADGDPRKGTKALKRKVVLARRGNAVSAGMREWSRLGWYEMAAFATIHARCCEGPLNVEHATFRVCNLGDALDALHRAVRAGASTDAALEQYGEAARCAWKSKNGDVFGQTAPPTAQQLGNLIKTLARGVAK